MCLGEMWWWACEGGKERGGGLMGWEWMDGMGLWDGSVDRMGWDGIGFI